MTSLATTSAASVHDDQEIRPFHGTRRRTDGAGGRPRPHRPAREASGPGVRTVINSDPGTPTAGVSGSMLALALPVVATKPAVAGTSGVARRVDRTRLDVNRRPRFHTL
jgi:hypothetical protein